MSSTMLMLGAAACGAAKCPAHAAVALGGALAVGFVAGWFAGRRGKGGCQKKGGAKGAHCACGAHAPAERRPYTEMRVPIPAGSVEIYVGNLSYDLTEEGLRKEFEAFGKVDTARVVLNRFNGKSKGFGFVVMPNRPEAEAAIAALNDKEILGRKMRANEAKNTVKVAE